ncbi:MAG: DUF6468 domain-containing protein [Xanthobacteraceae bacterium]
MTNGIGVLIDGVVAILLMVTIGYCIMLNRRLKLLKADEHSLRATISELVTATEIAERAIGGLKLTVHECDTGLGERLRKAERVTIEIDRSVTAGKELLGRLSQIVTAGRGSDHYVAALSVAPHAASEPDIKPGAKAEAHAEVKVAAKVAAKAVAAAAEAFAERLRNKVHGLAA